MKKLSHILFLLIATLTFVLVSTSVLGQDVIKGKYTGEFGLMGADLTLKEDGTYKYKYVNGESGSGAVYYGNWTLGNDTLTLNHHYFRETKGIGRSGIRTKCKKHKTQKFEKWIFQDGRICVNNTSNEYNCLELKK
ncbi:MAG: hypothetical protein COA58_02830 [Bacteroidetes bacterium]|nr:MAG: hypothetical protein COA58_02830 [Bacteroidota bacterium]